MVWSPGLLENMNQPDSLKGTEKSSSWGATRTPNLGAALGPHPEHVGLALGTVSPSKEPCASGQPSPPASSAGGVDPDSWGGKLRLQCGPSHHLNLTTEVLTGNRGSVRYTHTVCTHT